MNLLIEFSCNLKTLYYNLHCNLIVSTVLTYLILNTLHYLMLCIDSVDIDSIEYIRNPGLVSTVSTYIVFDSMIEKLSVSVFQNFNWIENQLNIKKVMSKNVYVLCIDSVDID